MRYNKLIERLQKLTGETPTQTELANILGIKPNAMSGRAARNSNFTDEELIKIEDANGLAGLLTGELFIKDDIAAIQNKSEDCITLDHIGIHPSCGKGTDVYYDPEINPIQIGLNLIKNIFKISYPNSLKTFTASGDSMNPIIEHGDLILVDTGDVEFTNGGIFLLTIDNSWFIKRLRLRITGELDIISDNPKYPIETLVFDTFKEVSIKGRVIKNLSRGL